MYSKKLKVWMLFVILISGITFVSCSKDDDFINPQARLNRGMEDAAYDYTGMTDVQIFNSDYKDYDINGHLIGIGCIKCKQTEIEDFIDRMLAVMPEVIIENKRDMLFAMVNILVPNAGEDKEIKPFVEKGFYFIYHGHGAKEVAEAVFGTSVREGVCFSEKNMSRKQLVPLITELRW